MKVLYSKHKDVLYIIFAPAPKRCDYVEDASGAIIRIDDDTKTVVSIAVPDFLRRAGKDGVAADIPLLVEGIGAREYAKALAAKRGGGEGEAQ